MTARTDAFGWAELTAEVDRLHTWPGLMSLLDEHYPASIFPTEEDRADRDDGPRIISLIRHLDQVRGERDAAMRNWTDDVQDAWQPIVEAASTLVARWLNTRHSFTAEEQALIELIEEVTH